MQSCQRGRTKPAQQTLPPLPLLLLSRLQLLAPRSLGRPQSMRAPSHRAQ